MFNSAIFEVENRADQPNGGIRQSYSPLKVILEFNSCQRRFCFPVKVKEAFTDTPIPAGEYRINIGRTVDHGRTTLLDESYTNGYIIVY